MFILAKLTKEWMLKLVIPVGEIEQKTVLVNS